MYMEVKILKKKFIPPDEVDYSYDDAPYIRHSKIGIILSMIGLVLAFVACGCGIDTPISTVIVYGIASIIFMALGVAMHD